MSRLAPLAVALALMLAVQPVLARPARVVRNTSGMDRRELALVVKALADDPNLIDEILATDTGFRSLAETFVPAYRGRMAGGRALLALGAIFMGLGALVGAPMYLNSDFHRAGIGVLAGAIGGGFVLFVPGVALVASPSEAERTMREYWLEHRASFLRPEATGPRLRLAAGWSLPRTAAVPLFTIPF